MRHGLYWSATACAVAGTFMTLTLSAEDPKAAEKMVVAAKLDNPSGVVVHEGTGDVFIAARSGVHRLSGGKLHAEVAGFATDIYGKGPMYNIAPLGVAFLDAEHLIVGDGSQVDGKEVVLVFKVGEKAGKSQKPGDAVHTLGPIKAGAESAKGEGNFYGVAVLGDGIYVTCNGDDTKGWVARSVVAEGKPGELKPYIASKVATGVDAPVGITTSPDKKHLVVSQMGEMNVEGDSLLTIYEPETGKLLHSLKTGLNDIAGLAYSPKTGKLYAVDFSWVNTKNGGLFRLDVEGEEVKAEKILSLDKPTALAFDGEGNLYITEFGTSEDPAKPAGQVIKIKSGL